MLIDTYTFTVLNNSTSQESTNQILELNNNELLITCLKYLITMSPISILRMSKAILMSKEITQCIIDNLIIQNVVEKYHQYYRITKTGQQYLKQLTKEESI